jgi:UDP-GlcNAc:undecaprenyl-phosphate GlcNAc-1-phosphate transferase
VLGGPALLLACSPFIPVGMALALGGFCVVGLIDDYVRMSPGSKATALMAPCLLSAWLFDNPWVAPACWVSANALNMLDHADGIASSACVGSLLVADSPLGLPGAGVSFGFLAHNWHPARMFLGDSGSLMLGAMLVLAWAPKGLPMVIAGTAIPLAEAVFVVVRRLRSRKAPWVGGIDHSGHSLLRLGLSPHALPPIYGISAALFALFGLAVL